MLKKILIISISVSLLFSCKPGNSENEEFKAKSEKLTANSESEELKAKLDKLTADYEELRQERRLLINENKELKNKLVASIMSNIASADEYYKLLDEHVFQVDEKDNINHEMIKLFLLNSKEKIWNKLNHEEYSDILIRLKAINSSSLNNSKININASKSNNSINTRNKWGFEYLGDTIGLDFDFAYYNTSIFTKFNTFFNEWNGSEVFLKIYGKNLFDKVIFILEKIYTENNDFSSLYESLYYTFETTANLDYEAKVVSNEFVNEEYEYTWNGIQKFFFRLEKKLPGSAEFVRGEIKNYLILNSDYNDSDFILKDKVEQINLDFIIKISKEDRDNYSSRRDLYTKSISRIDHPIYKEIMDNNMERVKILLNSYINQRYLNDDGSSDSILWDVISKGDNETLEFFLKNGALFDQGLDSSGNIITDYEFCIKNNMHEKLEILFNYDYLNTLIEIRDKQSYNFTTQTILMILVGENKYGDVENIIDKVNDINLIGASYKYGEDIKTYTALDLSQSKEMTKLLIEHGAVKSEDLKQVTIDEWIGIGM